MTQSDSPDFEFDISDLEVEDSLSSASNAGDPTPAQRGESVSSVQHDASEEEHDGELEGFAIDELPDASGEVGAADSGGSARETERAAEVEQGKASLEEPELKEVSRVEPEAEAKPSRALGDDDLGADVFAEIDDSSDTVSFSDVIDDLLEEVEEFEAGGFVDLDDVSSSKSEDDDEIFRMEDPDDSLGKSVDPNEVEEEAKQGSAPAFPSPPTDFEIPADPEPELAASTEPMASPDPQAVAAEEVPGKPRPSVTQAKAPVSNSASRASSEQSSDQSSASPSVANPSELFEATSESSSVPPRTVSDPDPSQQQKFDPEMLIPADDDSVSGADQGFDLEAEEKASIPAEPDDLSEASIDEAIPAVEGHENVLFSAEEEEAASNEFVQDSAEPEPIQSQAADTAALSEPDVAQASGSGHSEIESQPEVSAKEPGNGVSESPIAEGPDAAFIDLDEDAEDLSDLIEAGIELEEDLDGSEPEASKAEDSAEDANPIEEAPVESVSNEEAVEAVSTEEPGADDAAPLNEVGSAAEVDIHEEEEDLSDLIEAGAAVEDLDEGGDAEEVEPSSDEEVALPSAEELIADSDPEPQVDESDSDDGDHDAVSDVTLDSDGLDDEDISDLVASAGALEPEEAQSPSEELEATEPVLEEVDQNIGEEDEEIVSLPVPEIPGLVEVEEPEAEAEAEAAEEKPATPPTAEELLMRAGSLLNGDSEKPAKGASTILDSIGEDDDDEEIVAMPSPEAMIGEAAEDDDDDEEVMVMPDPASLMTEAGEGIAVIDDDEEEEVAAPGNVADRAGDLPPPPPAPVEIIDDENPEEDAQTEAPAEAGSAEQEADSDASGDEPIEDPFASEISLDDFNEGLEGFGDENGEDDESIIDDLDAGEAEEDAVPAAPAASAVVEMPKPSLLWRVTHSMAVAAGLVLVGLASVLAVWKQQIVEFYEGRDIDGSALVREIEAIGMHALEEFDESGLYRMQWVDSEVRRVSKNEIRLHALIGAQLREDLYKPVLESELGRKFGYDEQPLMDSLSYAHQHFPEEIGYYPDKPWDRLYKLSAAKGEVLPLRVTYGLTRPAEDEDWQLSRVKVSGYEKELEWPEGEVAYAFGENAYDIDSVEFAKLYSEYRNKSQEYVARIEHRKADVESGRLALQRENDRQRQRVRMALSEGAFFDGVAILGEDAAESKDVQLLITEVRDEGSFVKGVVRMSAAEAEQSKYFVGSLDFETTMTGKEQGYLSLTTVSMDAMDPQPEESAFFHANTVSRMKLRADGLRLEGDSRDLSFRLTRNM